MAAPSGPPVFSNQELVNELEGLLPTHWDEQQLERKWDACVANPDGGLERFAFTAMELKYLARERLAEVHALRVENNLLRGENASLAARCDAMQKLVQEAVPEAASRLEYERSSYRVAKFRDAVAALYEKKRLDAPPPCRDAVREFVMTKAEALAQYKNGRLDKAVDAMRHLKTTEWTLRLGDVQGPIGAPRNEPMVRTRSKLPGIITPEVNSDLYVWTPTPSSAESAAECECFLEAMKRSILERLAVEPRGAARRILRPGPQVLSPEDPLPSRGLP
jgi:hypothetical protein